MGATGVPHGGASTATSPWGEAVELDGTDDWIEIDDDLRDPSLYGGSGGDFTISARLRVDDADKTNHLCFGCAPYKWMMVGSTAHGRVVRTRVRDVVSGGNPIFASDADQFGEGSWHTVTMVVEGGTGVKFHFDCARGHVEQSSNPDPYEAIYADELSDTDIGLHEYSNSYIGKATAGNWFGGDIDDLRVWDRALTDAELAMLCADPADPPCETSLTIDPPTPPQSYTLPTKSVTTVKDAEELEDAVEAGISDNIILKDGDYNHSDLYVVAGYQNGEWLRIYGQKLWAESAGGAVLNFGVETGGNNNGFDFAGPEFHGLVFDIDDADHAVEASLPGACDTTTDTAPTSAVSGWNDSTDMVVEDCVFRGNGVVGAAVNTTAYDGLVVERVQIYDFLRYGVKAQHSGATGELADPMIIRDVAVERIMDPTCWGDECASCGYSAGADGTCNLAWELRDRRETAGARCRVDRHPGRGVDEWEHLESHGYRSHRCRPRTSWLWRRFRGRNRKRSGVRLLYRTTHSDRCRLRMGYLWHDG